MAPIVSAGALAHRHAVTERHTPYSDSRKRLRALTRLKPYLLQVPTVAQNATFQQLLSGPWLP